MTDWKTCYFCPCSKLCTEDGALCQNWSAGPQQSPGPLGFGDQWHIDEIVRLRADLAEAGEVISDLQTFTFTVSADMDAELRARVRAWRDRVK